MRLRGVTTPFRRRLFLGASATALAAVMAVASAGAQDAPAKQEVPGKKVEIWRSFSMGAWRLTELKAGRAELGDTEREDGVLYQHFHLKARGGSFELDAQEPGFEPLKGKLTNVDIKGMFSDATGFIQPVFKIPPGHLSLTLRFEGDRLPGYWGGELVLPERPVWVGNTESIETRPAFDGQPASARGTLSFPTHPVKLEGASIELPWPGTTFHADLTSIDPDGKTGARFAYDLQRGTLQLVAGTFAGKLPAQDSFELDSAGFAGDVLDLEPVAVTLAIKEDRGLLELGPVTAQVDGVMTAADSKLPMLVRGRWRLEKAVGAVPMSAERARPESLELIGLGFEAAEPQAVAAAFAGGQSFRSAVLTGRPATPSFARAAREDCVATAERLSGRQKSFLERRGWPTPEEQVLRSIRAAQDSLGQIQHADVAVHLPRQRILQLLREPSGLPDWVVEALHFRRQELLLCLGPEAFSDLAAKLLPVRLLVHWGTAVERADLVLRPAVRLAWLGSFSLPTPGLLDAFISRLEASLLGPARQLKPEIRVPLPLQLRHQLEAPPLNVPGLTFQHDEVTLDLTVKAALLVEPEGIHVLAQIER